MGSPADLDSQLKTVSGGVEQADPGLSAVKSASELIIHELALAGLSGGKLERSRSILRIIEKSKDLHVDGDSWHLKFKDERNETASVPLLDLLPVLQLPTKKLTTSQLNCVKKLSLPSHLVANTYVKQLNNSTAACFSQPLNPNLSQPPPHLSDHQQLERISNGSGPPDNLRPPVAKKQKEGFQTTAAAFDEISQSNHLEKVSNSQSAVKPVSGTFPPWVSLFGGASSSNNSSSGSS